jgi:hypothetical protein
MDNLKAYGQASRLADESIQLIQLDVPPIWDAAIWTTGVRGRCDCDGRKALAFVSRRARSSAHCKASQSRADHANFPEQKLMAMTFCHWGL